MTIDEFILAVQTAADEALPPAVRALFGPSVEPPPTLAQVEAFEAEIGATLPDDYRQFLLRCNGGRLDWFQYDGPTPDGKTWQAVIREVGGLREESGLSLRAARSNYQGYELQIPRRLLWIMGDPGGNAFCLGLSGPYRGRVYFWVHDEQPAAEEWDGGVESAGNVVPLATSFTDFVAGIRPKQGDNE